ncbi:MAG: VOC family protein [Pelagimonas sp.]
MIDHVTIGVADFARSTAFYDAALAPLGVRFLVYVPKEGDDVNLAGYGKDQPFLWLAEENPTSGMMHIALQAATHAEVNAFYAAALRAGGTDNGAPGLRPHYHQDYYAAYVLDPEGHNIEAVCHLPSP